MSVAYFFVALFGLMIAQSPTPSGKYCGNFVVPNIGPITVNATVISSTYYSVVAGVNGVRVAVCPKEPVFFDRSASIINFTTLGSPQDCLNQTIAGLGTPPLAQFQFIIVMSIINYNSTY